ncbi:regulator of gene activity isoform X2 [Eupeodes corollae]|uniref:regulator of gene activity isoform X2 n=1 Tax=Eupeodes corollae TaxID=290404 RepID=UPI002491E845|nr:regulator of gene activity isoform X2 [Eupeodes corollae]
MALLSDVDLRFNQQDSSAGAILRQVMANLNFQQPPRSIANSSIGRSTGGGFGGSSLSGHVTPTSGMFPTGLQLPIGGANYGQSQQPQLSPNRNAQLSVGGPALSSSGRPNIFNQRQFVERRTMQGLSGGPMSNMGSFMQSTRGYGSGGTGNSLNNFHNVFGGSGDTATPPLLDLSEFPSLTNVRGQNDQSLPQTNPLQPPGSKPYGSEMQQSSLFRFLAVGMVKQPTSEQSEFTMSNEDFPALPGTQNSDGTTNAGLSENNLDGTEKSMNSIVGSGLSVGGGMDHQNDNSSNDKIVKRGVQTSPDGKVTNIPATMVNNQFGMVGLLTFIRAAESDPNLVSLAMGQDLTGLGLNLNSQENLHPTFAGPFADQPCRAQDVDYSVPPEYLINFAIRDKLSHPVLKKLQEDLLFFLFYTNIGDVMQLMAAAELHNREWRYHIEEKIWITRIPGLNQYEKNGTKERGTFYYFDAQTWRRMSKVFQIDAEKLDKCPNISAFMNLNGQSV